MSRLYRYVESDDELLYKTKRRLFVQTQIMKVVLSFNIVMIIMEQQNLANKKYHRKYQSNL